MQRSVTAFHAYKQRSRRRFQAQQLFRVSPALNHAAVGEMEHKHSFNPSSASYGETRQKL